jgi:hypothetical protein
LEYRDPPGPTKAIAAEDPDVCDYFTEQGAAQFAATVDTDSCAEAITVLVGQVTDPAAYINPDDETVTTRPPAPPRSTPAPSRGTGSGKVPSRLVRNWGASHSPAPTQADPVT